MACEFTRYGPHPAPTIWGIGHPLTEHAVGWFCSSGSGGRGIGVMVVSINWISKESWGMLKAKCYAVSVESGKPHRV